MGKQMRRKDSDVGMKENRPGCIWGIFQILDYHHWHMVKKILPNRWHTGERHGRSDENQGEHLLGFRDDEAEQIVSIAETNHAKKRSLKKEGPIRRVFGFSGRSRLCRTVSIHHLEPSDPRLGGRSTASAVESPDLPVLKASEELAARNIVDFLRQTWDAKKHGIFHKRSEKARKASMYQNIMDSDNLNRDVSDKECPDVLELLNIDKDFFVKILQDPDFGIANRFNSLQTSNSRIKLDKSVSFPTADSGRRRNFKPSKLKHKQNEIWSLPKREKLLNSAQSPNLRASKSSKDIYVADSFVGSALEQEDVNHLEDTKQRAEQATEKSTMDIDLLLHGRLSTDETDIPGYGHSNDRVCFRRTSSLNNSMERYNQLFEHGFKRVGRWHHSKSLKATNENDFLPGRRHGRGAFSRNLSLPEFDFYSAQPNELSSGAICSEQASRTSSYITEDITSDSHNEPKPGLLPSRTEEIVALEAVLSAQSQDDLVDSDYQNGRLSENADQLNTRKSYELENILPTDTVAVAAESQNSKNGEGAQSEDMDEPIKTENSLSRQEQDMYRKKNSQMEHAQPSPDSVLENYIQCLTPDPEKSSFSQGLKPKHLDFEVSDISNICVQIDHEIIKSVKKDEAEFNYVRDVLELSGLTGKEHLEEWHSLDQPMSPSVFEEMETCLPDETRSAAGEEVSGSCDHQLLFDLVNQALLEIYQRSFTYYPRALSYSCRVHPIPVKDHFVEAVWTSIRGRLSSGQEQTLNDVVAGDLAKDDGWMNMQSETECLALGVEDIIFHELLDELFCC